MIRRELYFLCALVVSSLIISGAAIACNPPVLPASFTSAGLSAGYPDYNRYRAEIEKYQGDGNLYLRCLQNDLSRLVNEVNNASRDYEWKKSQYENALRALNSSADKLNRLNARYQSLNDAYDKDSRAIQSNINTIIDHFNRSFSQ